MPAPGEAFDLLKQYCSIATPLQAYHIGQAVREGRRVDGLVGAHEVARIADLLASFGPLTADPRST